MIKVTTDSGTNHLNEAAGANQLKPTLKQLADAANVIKKLAPTLVGARLARTEDDIQTVQESGSANILIYEIARVTQTGCYCRLVSELIASTSVHSKGGSSNQEFISFSELLDRDTFVSADELSKSFTKQGIFDYIYGYCLDGGLLPQYVDKFKSTYPSAKDYASAFSIELKKFLK